MVSGTQYIRRKLGSFCKKSVVWICRKSFLFGLEWGLTSEKLGLNGFVLALFFLAVSFLGYCVYGRASNTHSMTIRLRFEFGLSLVSEKSSALKTGKLVYEVRRKSQIPR